MKKLLNLLVIPMLALVGFACTPQEAAKEDPIQYSLTADEAFVDGSATVTVHADKAPAADVEVTISISGSSTIPSECVSLNPGPVVVLKAGQKEAQVTLSIPEKNLPPDHTSAITVTGSIEGNLFDQVIITASRGSLAGAWSIIGPYGWEDGKDIALVEAEDGWYIADEVLIARETSFKFRRDGKFDVALGLAAAAAPALDESFDLDETEGCASITIAEPGIYSVALNPNKKQAMITCDLEPLTSLADIKDFIDENEGEEAWFVADLKDVIFTQNAGKYHYAEDDTAGMLFYGDYGTTVGLPGQKLDGVIVGKAKLYYGQREIGWIDQDLTPLKDLIAPSYYEIPFTSVTIEQFNKYFDVLEHCNVRLVDVTNFYGPIAKGNNYIAQAPLNVSAVNAGNYSVLYVNKAPASAIPVNSEFTVTGIALYYQSGGNVTKELKIWDPEAAITNLVLPISYTFSGDAQFAEGKATLKVTASRAVEEDTDFAVAFLPDASTIPFAALDMPDEVVIKAGETEGTAVVSIKDESLIPEGETVAKFQALGDDGSFLAETVEITYNKAHVPAPVLKYVYGMFTTDASTPWYADVSAGGAALNAENQARSIAQDDEYIYLPKSSAYPAIFAIKKADLSITRLSSNGMDVGGTFKSCFARMMKNTDASVNGGKDILLVSNCTAAVETDGGPVKIYAYKDGIDKDPVQLAAFAWDSANNTGDYRRYGDRFFVTGTWQEGKIWLPGFNAPKTVVLSVANGARTAVTQINGGTYSPDGIKDLSVYPGGSEIFLTNASIANLLKGTGNKANGWDEFTLDVSSTKGKGTFGYNFFEFNGKKYIAYARLVDGTHAQIEVIEDQGSEANFVASIEAQAGLLTAPLHNQDASVAAAVSSTLVDCSVRVIGEEVYIAGLFQNGGCALYKLVIE